MFLSISQVFSSRVTSRFFVREKNYFIILLRIHWGLKKIINLLIYQIPSFLRVHILLILKQLIKNSRVDVQNVLIRHDKSDDRKLLKKARHVCANFAIYSTVRTVSVNTQQFHALASNEKSIGRYDIIRRCTMGNKLRNYHTKRLPVPSTIAQPNRRTDWTAKARSARARARS